MALVKARVGSAATAGGSRQDTIEEELEERRPPGAPYSHEAALAELRRDVRVEVQRLQQKVATPAIITSYFFQIIFEPFYAARARGRLADDAGNAPRCRAH